ncbi:MAG TPA: hypothetical protein VGE74_28320, partial [Gemmata sp.]
RAVVYGHLKNPRVDPRTDEGATDLNLTGVLKDDPARGTQTVLTLRSYLPVVGDAPSEYLVFCTAAKGKLEPTTGIPSSGAVVEYLKGAAKLPENDPTARLAYYFVHLSSANAVIAGDAFVEFARATDADIAKAAKHFSPAALQKLIADEKTPSERIGVFAYLLGVSGGANDAAFLEKMLKQQPLSVRAQDSFGGLLAGYVLLDAKGGWALAAAVLADTKLPYAVRLSSLGTVRFFQAAHGARCKADVLKCCAALLPDGDFADQAVEDLRRWGWWDLSAEVFAQFAKPTHAAPIVRRGIVRYALSCPNDDAKKFLATVRQSDPKLVAAVEEMLKLYAPAPPLKK